MKQKFFCLLITLLTVVPSFAANLSLSGFYSGKLANGKYAKIYLHQTNDKLYGYYGIDPDIKVTYIPNAKTITGNIEMGNFIVLKESDRNGDIRVFEGFLDKEKLLIRGDWLYPNAEAVDLQPLEIQLNDNVRLGSVHTEEVDSELHKAVTMNVPELKAKDKLTENETKFMDYVNNRLFKLKNEFTRDVLISESKNNEIFFGNSTLNVDHEVTYARYPFISIRFNVSTYYAGAAHPMHSTLTVNYDLSTGEPLLLNKLFKKYSNYLQYLSELSQYQLEQHLQKLMGHDEDPKATSFWIKHGTKAVEDNFKNWNFTEMGLLVSFEPYQVAPYYFGRQEIIIPYTLLNEAFQDKLQALFKEQH